MFSTTRRASVIQVLLLAFILLSFSAVPALATEEKAGRGLSIAETFLDEELVYSIGFWFFKDVAEGKLSLKADGAGRYTATLAAHTNGVVDTLLRHRRDRYVAKLKLSEDGGRFVTESFEKAVEMDGKGVRRSLHTVDYEKRVVVWKSWGGGRDEKSGVEKIPEGGYADDPIAAFYNFRYGVYGTIGEGREYRIFTFPKEDRNPEIFIRMATEKELQKRNKLGKDAAEYLADARIDKDLFGSKEGDIEILFTRDMLPVQAVAKGILVFGDVKGRLREVTPGTAVLKKAVSR